MPSTTDYGERIPLRRASKFKKWIRRADWEGIEKLADMKFDRTTRAKINIYTQLYGSFGPIYSIKQSVLTRDAASAIESFRKASQRLHDKLLHQDADPNSLFPALTTGTLPPSASLTPVGQVVALALLADATCQHALNSLHDEKRNRRIHHDLWEVWACLAVKEFTKAGFPITGASLDKGDNKSPAILVFQRLQDCLPAECHRFNGYESVRIAVNDAKAKLAEFSEKDLLQIIAGWGSQTLSGYPGSLMSASKEDIKHFRDLAQQVREDAPSTLREPRKDNL